MPETKIKTRVQKTVRSTITFTEDEVEAILRKYVGAPDTAVVSLECSYDSFDSASVTWQVVEETDIG